MLLVLYVKTQDFDTVRHARLLAQLVDARKIDTRWSNFILETRQTGPSTDPVAAEDLPQVIAALDAMESAFQTRVMQATVADLRKAYTEKAELVARIADSNVGMRQALANAMRADTAVAAQVRTSWREFSQRDRLVAAENLVARTLAEAQAYAVAPGDDRRAALLGFAGDLRRTRGLPPGFEGPLSKLEADVHQLLLLRPLVQTMEARLVRLGTSGRLDELIDLVQRNQLDAAAARARYRTYLFGYAALLLALGAYAAIRLIDRFRAQEMRRAELEIALAAALDHGERREPAGPRHHAPEEVVDIVVKPYRRG